MFNRDSHHTETDIGLIGDNRHELRIGHVEVNPNLVEACHVAGRGVRRVAASLRAHGSVASPLNGERIPGNKTSRIEPLNPFTRPSATLSPTGGEGRVRGQRATGRFMESFDDSRIAHWHHELTLGARHLCRFNVARHAVSEAA